MILYQIEKLTLVTHTHIPHLVPTKSISFFFKTLKNKLDLLSLERSPNPKDLLCTSGPCSIRQKILAEGELSGITLRELDQFPVNLKMEKTKISVHQGQPNNY